MRAQLLDYVSVECAGAIAQVDLLTGGLCDLLRAASERDGALNTPSAAVVVRSALEIGGQALWLLDGDINGVERGRRYLNWRFDDLKQMRYLMQSTSGDATVDDEARRYADNIEQALIEQATAASWEAKPQRVLLASVEPARLIGSDGKSVKLPGNGEFAVNAALWPDAYKMLSVSTHGQRYGFFASVKSDEENGKSRSAGTMLDPSLLVRWGINAVALPALALARWNRLDSSELRALVAPLASKPLPGITRDSRARPATQRTP